MVVTMESTPYVIYGTSRWNDAWLTEQNLAYALARRHQVLYVEPPLTPLTPIRYGVRPNTVAQAGRLVRRRMRRMGKLRVLSPIVLPPRSYPAARALSAPLLRWQVRRGVRRLGMTQPVAVTAQWAPGLVGAAGESQLVCLVKDWVEAGADLLGRDRQQLVRERDTMLAAADVVCTTSRNLQMTLRERGTNATLLPHGFHAELAASYHRAEHPPEYNGLPRPLLGYTGRIDDRLDFDALDALARRYEDGSLILIGPVSPRLPADRIARLRSRPNIHLLGARRRTSLPAYLVYLDCCLLPYRDSEWLRHGSPLKLWDYLYAGPPIVGSGCAALRDFPPPLVEFATGPSAFCAAVERVLHDDDATRAVCRRQLALANTWDDRAADLHRLLTGAGRPSSMSGAGGRHPSVCVPDQQPRV